MNEVLTLRLPLQPLSAFADLAAVLGGRRIWFVTGVGNAGDSLIHAGTHCLFHKIGTEVVERAVRPDFLVWGGGGNIGTLWPGSYQRRQREFAAALAQRIPIVVLPQSATDGEPMPPGTRFFARERSTQAQYAGSALAPDLALAFDDDVSGWADRAPRFPLGVFLRTDAESAGACDPRWSIVDPPKSARTYLDYFDLAADFGTIATDRLHFAIAALILGRPAILLPNSYFKNSGVFTEWLRPLGCQWGAEALATAMAGQRYDAPKVRAFYANRGHASAR